MGNGWKMRMVIDWRRSKLHIQAGWDFQNFMMVIFALYAKNQIGEAAITWLELDFFGLYFTVWSE